MMIIGYQHSAKDPPEKSCKKCRRKFWV